MIRYNFADDPRVQMDAWLKVFHSPYWSKGGGLLEGFLVPLVESTDLEKSSDGKGQHQREIDKKIDGSHDGF